MGHGVKKLPIAIALLAAVTGLGLAGCDSSDDETPVTPPPSTFLIPSASASVVPSTSVSVKPIYPSGKVAPSASPSVSVSVSVSASAVAPGQGDSTPSCETDSARCLHRRPIH